MPTRPPMKQPTARLTMVTAGVLFFVLICAVPTGLWLFEIATPFRLQLALVAVAVAATNAWHRRKYATTLCLLSAIYLCSHLPAYYLDAAAPSSTDRPTLRMMHWNTWRDVHSVSDMHWALQEYQPDLAFFQEVTEAEAAEFESNHYEKQYIGDFLLLRKPGVEITVPAHDPQWTELPAAELSIRFDQREIDLYSIHPPAPFTPRRLRARNEFFHQLADVVAGGRNSSVVIGDFNAVATENVFTHLLQFAGLKDSMTGFGHQTSWPFAQWWNPMLQIAIDHCVACPKLQVINREVAGSRTSNHKPLIVDLQWVSDSGQRTQA